LPDCIGSNLPDHQSGLLRDDVSAEPLHFDRRFLAAYSLVDHGDPAVRIFGLKKCQQPLGIGLDVAFARRGRRADRDDPGLPCGETPRKTGQAVLEWNRQNRDL
jgi:hypothetical protein